MDDDINTADAIAAIFDIVKEVNTNINATSNSSKEIIDFSLSLIKELGGVLGIAQRAGRKFSTKRLRNLLKEGRRRERKKIGRRLMKSETSSKKWE